MPESCTEDMERTRILSHRQAARFYDLLGTGLDTQAFYEDAPLRELADHLDLKTSRAVIEYGCGTGRLAAKLLEAYLPAEATYLGLDISRTMVGLTKRRLERWGERAEVKQCDGAPHLAVAADAFDRFVCTYVLELLSDDDIRNLLKEAHRVLRPNGLIGIACLTNGPTPTSRFVSTVWRGLYRLSPWLVGGCQPISIRTYLEEPQWSIEHVNIVVKFGVPSEIVVARRDSGPHALSA